MNFGIKTKAIHGGALTSANCPTCNTANLHNRGFLRHFHIYGLPIIPVGGGSLVGCNTCDYTQSLKSAPENIRTQASPPVTTKSVVLSSWGLLVIFALVIGVLLFAQNDKRENEAFAAAPQVGDVYIIRIAEVFSGAADSAFPYGVLRITSVAGNDVTFAIAKSGYGNLKSVRKSLRQDGSGAAFYSAETLSLPTNALPAMLTSGAIHDIKR